MEENLRCNHNVIMENRKKLTLTGIKDVISFDDETIILNSAMGKITVKGIGLHIINFNTTNGELTADGKICAVVYTEDEKVGGFFSRLLR